MPPFAVRRKGNRKVSRIKIPANTFNKSGRRGPRLGRTCGGKGAVRSMQVRPVTDTPRKRYRFGAPADAGRAALDVHRHRRDGDRVGPVRASLSRQRIDLRSVAVRDRHRRPVLPAVRHHADGAVAQQPARHGAAPRQDPLRGARRQHLGIEGGRGARHEPARSAGRPDRPPRRRGPHHLRQRRLLRADRHDARGAARHHDRAAVAAAGPRQRAAGRHAAARRADHDRRRRALARLARCRGLGREGRARRSAERRPRRHRPHRGRARARRGARRRRSRERRQVALPRHGVARDPHAAERHPRHGGSAARHAADAGADHLRQGHQDLRRRAAVADRGDSGFLQDRGRQARTRGAAVLADQRWSRTSSSCSARARRPRGWRSPPTSTSGCPSA